MNYRLPAAEKVRPAFRIPEDHQSSPVGPGDPSCRCRVCDADRSIVAVGEGALLAAGQAGCDAYAATPSWLLDDLERASMPPALTDAEFQAAKSGCLDSRPALSTSCRLDSEHTACGPRGCGHSYEDPGPSSRR